MISHSELFLSYKKQGNRFDNGLDSWKFEKSIENTQSLCTSKLKVLERRNARVCQGLSPDPDQLSDRSISLKYEPFPKIKTKTELFNSRKYNGIGANFADSLLGTLNTAEERLYKREEKYRIITDDRKTFTQLSAERKRKDMEYNEKTFGNVVIGIHRRELPKFESLKKNYFKGLRDLKSQTPELNFHVKKSIKSKSLEIAFKPNQVNPYEIDSKVYTENHSKYSRNSNFARFAKLIPSENPSETVCLQTKISQKKIRKKAQEEFGKKKALSIKSNYFRSSGFSRLSNFPE